MNLKFNNRFTQYKNNNKDLAMIEIQESDEIYKEIEFLDFDLNYIQKRIYNL